MSRSPTPQVPHFTKSPECHDVFKGTSPWTTSANYWSGKERKAAGVFWALWCALHPVSHLILYNLVKQHYLFFIHEEIFYRWLRPREVNSGSITQSVWTVEQSLKSRSFWFLSPCPFFFLREIFLEENGILVYEFLFLFLSSQVRWIKVSRLVLFLSFSSEWR